jgi:exopolysaccharide production protein ExoQ
MLCGLLLVEQAANGICPAFDPFSFDENCLAQAVSPFPYQGFATLKLNIKKGIIELMGAELQSSVPKQPARRATLKPARIDWIIAIFVLILQEGAFILLPIMINEDPTHPVLTPSEEYFYTNAKENEEPEPIETPFVTYGLIIGLLSMTISCIPRKRAVIAIIANNPFVFMYSAVLFLSALWSLHPDITIKRSVSYANTMAIAVYLIATFRADDSIKALSYSLAISAAGSIAFVFISPRIGIHQVAWLEGNWRGVFAHKNILGEAMAIGVFAQLYLLSGRIGSTIWNVLWLCVFGGLLTLSKSGTQLTISSLYLSGFFLYVVWLQNKLLGYAFASLFALVLAAVGIALAVDPGTLLESMGKDPTLTGRTDIWRVVLELIVQKPLFGWGFQALFVEGDAVTNWVKAQLQAALPHAHNAWLQITLEVGLVGLFLIVMIIGTALWRGLRCCSAGVLPLGFFSLVYFIGVTLTGFSESSIGTHRAPSWLVFVLLTFACGQSLSLTQGKRLARSSPMKIRS